MNWEQTLQPRGADKPYNMQLLTIENHRLKTKDER